MSEYDHDGGMAHLEHDGLEHRARKRPPAPGKATLTSRLGASPASIARAVVAQLKAAESPAPAAVQAHGDLDGPDVHALAAQGTAGGGGTLPFFDEIQRAFGHHDVSGVRAHVGGAAADASAAMGARAYAAGDAVAFAEAPDLHLAAHEAAHVVQQRGGVRLSDGVGRSGDEYERHADAVADAVVRGDSAQALLDGMAHRGAAGGPAVQRDPGPGAQALDELLARTPRPPAAEIVSIIRLHPREQRAIVAAVRERCGAELADEVQRIASILPAQAALAAQPPPDAGPDLRGPGPRPASRTVPQPSVSRGDGGTVDVTASPDDRSSVRARVRPSGADGSAPALRDVRVVVSGEGRDATGELSATVRPDGGAAASAEGAVRTDGGTVLRGQAEAELEPGDHGPEAAASAGATVEIPLDDRNTLIAGGVIHSDGRLDLSVGVDLLHRRVRDLPLSEASRRPLLRLFVNVTTPLEGGTPSVSGGAAVQFSRAGGVGQAGDRYERHADAVADAVVRGDSAQSLLDSLLGPAPSAAPAVQKQDREVSESARTQALGHLPLHALIPMFADSYGNGERLPPERVDGVNIHRTFSREWLQANRERLLARIRQELERRAAANSIDGIEEARSQANRMPHEAARARLLQLIQETTGGAVAANTQVVEGGIRTLREALARFASGPGEQIAFQGVSGPIFAAQVQHYDNFAGAMNIFRSCILQQGRPTPHGAPLSRTANQAAHDAWVSLSPETQRALSGAGRAPLEAALIEEGRAQLRAVASRRSYDLAAGYPEQAIR